MHSMYGNVYLSAKHIIIHMIAWVVIVSAFSQPSARTVSTTFKTKQNKTYTYTM